ncbi:39S ribosomal protein L22, mitochondrial-like [Homalodisca vitripennis]|uniref:39S ribosomal protein L22, mitochondrial-like n=1 Tax=Homalodisca vitripennis TaxID=197043 RepID=UPI001EEC831D|nr:39S ribosomal protein L22, mitochondrial-like [Homalodisca vitripennis]XP_046671882.1 39S ribosomal protein L22, mitochondrial-like [Homalodisca vitripennis]
MWVLQNCIATLARLGNVSACYQCCRSGLQLGPASVALQRINFHTSEQQLRQSLFPEPKKWPTYNEKVFPPQQPDEERRPAYVCHMKLNIHHSPKKMWYVAILVRGMSVDEAVKQLSFVPRKGAVHVKETILEAQRLAVEEHNVEFKSNLWVAESFVGKGLTVKGLRRHARMRPGRIDYRYCHYFVRLEEGPPPKQYYWSEDRSGEGLLKKWLQEKRDRAILNTL